MPATMTSDIDTLLLALATLGKAPELEMILIAKVSKEGDNTSQYHRHLGVQMSHNRLTAKKILLEVSKIFVL